jgi:hypothetical protein
VSNRTLAEYYLADARLVLVPIEHLAPSGMSREFADLLRDRRGWSSAQIDLFDRSFRTYWQRSSSLARRTRTWMPPRLRHVGVVTEPGTVRPYVQLLNTSAWLLYASDFDPERSDPEFTSYLFAHGDRMALTGEVTLAALHDAAWWLERSDEECAAFAAASARSPRPDAAGYLALASALPWLRRLRHEDLDPPLVVSPHRAIPGTGLLVPQALEREPRALVDAWSVAATGAIESYRRSWRAAPGAAIAQVRDWLAVAAPPLLVTAERGRVVWDPEQPALVEALGTVLDRGDATAVASIEEDLRTIARHTRAFLDALVEPAALPMPALEIDQGGYSWLHRTRRLIAYEVDESGMERLCGPALPYARAMLGARTVHEWAHLAVDAGWVPCVAGPGELAARQAGLAEILERVIAAAPAVIRTLTMRDLAEVGGGESPAQALAHLFLARMPDYQANLLAQRFLDRGEIETYTRHNIRTLRFTYPPPQLFRMLIRYLFEMQYLGFSEVAERDRFFVRSTWFDADFFATGVLDVPAFSALARAAAAICACYAVDETRFRGIVADGQRGTMRNRLRSTLS